jgi:hypothetical protein
VTWRRAVSRVPLARVAFAALVVCAAGLAALPAGVADSGSTVSQTAANALAAKIALLTNPNPRGRGAFDPVSISDTEANSYLKLRGREFLPPAVKDPEIHILPNHLAGAADVDFDELGKMNKQGDDLGAKLVAYVFQGKQRVSATGTLETGDGQGKFILTSFTVGSTSLPAGFVTFLLQSYVEKQYKIDLNKPFRLPPHVSRIELGNGQATLLRSGPSRR